MRAVLAGLPRVRIAPPDPPAGRGPRRVTRGARRRVVAIVASTIALSLSGASAWADAPRAETAPSPGPASSPDPAPRAEHPCAAESPVTVRSASADDARLACEGVRRALAFLATTGLRAPPETVVDVDERLPADLDGRAVGCWIRETRRIHLVSWAVFESLREWFRTPVDPELYRAAASHEAAHAVAGCNSEPATLPLAAHEYVAYVTMFATMAPDLRARVLARFPGTGFGSTLQINAAVYLVDPLQFAADAWRHYLGRRDRAAWLRDMVAGRIVQEMPADAP